MAELPDTDRAIGVIEHTGFERDKIWSIFGRRWLDIALFGMGDLQQLFKMSVCGAVDLARRRRGIEPVRIIIMPMARSMRVEDLAEPLPVLV